MRTIITWRDLLDRTKWAEISRKSHYSVAGLAKYLGFSARQVERLMQGEFGLRPKAWLDDLQMQRTLELLTNSESSLKEVSYEAGFKRFERFCAKFKRRFGEPPGVWRARNVFRK